MSYAPTVVDRLSALKMALEQHGIVSSGNQVPVIDEAIELITKQHRCLMSWLQANAPGGWIDDLRKRADAATSSPDRNVEAVRTMLLELWEAAICLHRQMNYSESGSDDIAPIITRPEVGDVG